MCMLSGTRLVMTNANLTSQSDLDPGSAQSDQASLYASDYWNDLVYAKEQTVLYGNSRTSPPFPVLPFSDGQINVLILLSAIGSN